MLDAIKEWLRRGKDEAAELARREGDVDAETSTNAQVEGASGEPYPGRDPDD